METRASKRKAKSTENQNQPLKKNRVVLGELPHLTNAIVPQILHPHKTLKKPKLRKSISTKENHVDAQSSTQDIKLDGTSEIYKHLRTIEMEKKRRPMVDYMEKIQNDNITSNMRGILVDWLVEVGEEYKLLSDTLHLSVSYIDRFLSVHPVNKDSLQLLGVSSMLIASKHGEINPPHVEEFCFITDNTYSKAEVSMMESDILKTLNFEMSNPTVKTFLRRFNGFSCEDKDAQSLQFEFLSYYLAELSLLDYDCLRFLPSLVAASVTFLARFIIWPEVYPWTPALYGCVGYTPVELRECVLILHDLYMARRGGSFQAVREKYKQHKFKYVANLPSPPHIPASLFEEEE